MTISEPYLDIMIGDLPRAVSDLKGVISRRARLDIPIDFPLEGLQRARVDLEVIGQRLRDNPDEIRMLLHAFVTGENGKVQRLIRELELTEADFQEQGGGIFWAVVIVGVLCCASEAY